MAIYYHQASRFEIIPAIDILGGQVVRLLKGDYAKKTVFSDDPVKMAKHWAKQGAKRLHVVDLDGAKTGRPVNLAVIKKIVKAIKIPVQTGGGFRKLVDIEKAIKAGVDRVILGTAAAQDIALVARASRRWPGRIAVGIDVKGGKVAVRGWRAQTALTPARFAARLYRAGVRTFIYTNISKDGTLQGPDLKGTAALSRQLKKLYSQASQNSQTATFAGLAGGQARAASRMAASSSTAMDFALIASGGVTTKKDVIRLATLKKIGVTGAIVGRALYKDKLMLSRMSKSVAC